MKIPIVASTAMILLLSMAARAQSLADLTELARQERARRDAEPQGPVFTTESIRSASSVRAAAAIDQTAVRAADESPPVSEASDGGQSESEWRELFADARAEITRAEDRVRLNEQELQTLQRRLLTESGLYNREYQLAPAITAKQAELEAARQRVIDANQELQNLREELRRAGGPPGWSR